VDEENEGEDNGDSAVMMSRGIGKVEVPLV
jgi:hypothetical protein